MDELTIDDMPDELIAALTAQAVRHGRSLESEVKDILERAVAEPLANPGRRLFDAMAEIRSLGGVELDIPPREVIRPVKFD